MGVKKLNQAKILKVGQVDGERGCGVGCQSGEQGSVPKPSICHLMMLCTMLMLYFMHFYGCIDDGNDIYPLDRSTHEQLLGSS